MELLFSKVLLNHFKSEVDLQFPDIVSEGGQVLEWRLCKPELGGEVTLEYRSGSEPGKLPHTREYNTAYIVLSGCVIDHSRGMIMEGGSVNISAITPNRVDLVGCQEVWRLIVKGRRKGQ